MKNRYIQNQVLDDLKQKMVFIDGPRQVGKTTFAQTLYKKSDYTYLNWDIDEQRTLILKKELGHNLLIIFDELHKNKKWRGYLKGLFDSMKADESTKRQILVTGSARLDYYRFGGDSLQGRYHYLRLMPLSFHEIKASTKSDVLDLMKLSGFPEPFFRGSEKETKRWSNEYISRLVREEISDLEKVSDLATLETLAYALPQYVGSPLSINGLRENLQVAHETVSKWILIFERLYLIFRITPFTGSLLRSVKKEQKAYFYNWTYIEDESFRFENFMAFHLIKYCHWLEDSEGRRMTLHFTKQKNSPEIDFVVCENMKPIYFIEAKLGDQEINSRFPYFKNKYPNAKFFQVHLHGKKNYQSAEGFRVCPAHVFLKEHSLV